MPIMFEQVGYLYQAGTPFSFHALEDISFSIQDGEYMAIVGHTGSGKSTLIQHLNALLKPSKGIVKIDEQLIAPDTKEKELKPLRQKVGVVFQFPEAQLFEETVLKDVMFGPINFGDSQESARQKAIKALEMVGLSEENYEKSPFELSGGQMRRVAIAGILAMEPKVLVLDEPTAGLDPKGRFDMMQLFKRLHKQQGLTIVLVTHQMNDVADFADRVAVLVKGKLEKIGPPFEVFQQRDWLLANQIGLPDAMEMAYQLRRKGFNLIGNILTKQDLTQAIVRSLGGKSDVG